MSDNTVPIPPAIMEATLQQIKTRALSVKIDDEALSNEKQELAKLIKEYNDSWFGFVDHEMKKRGKDWCTECFGIFDGREVIPLVSKGKVKELHRFCGECLPKAKSKSFTEPNGQAYDTPKLPEYEYDRIAKELGIPLRCDVDGEDWKVIDVAAND